MSSNQRNNWLLRFPLGGCVPSSASSFCSSLFALRGNEEVLNLFSLFTAEWDPGCFTLISCAAGGAFLAEPCRKQESQRKGFTLLGRAGPGSVGTGGNGKAITLRRSSGVNAEPARGGVGRGSVRWPQAKEGKVRGKKGSRGVRRRDEDKRGSNSLPNQIRWFSAKQPDHRPWCTVQHPLTEFWDGPWRGRIIDWMEQIKLSMGTNSRRSSQSIRSGSIRDTSRIRVMYGDRLA